MKRQGIRRKRYFLSKMDISAWILCIPFIFGLYFFCIRPIAIGMGYSFFNLKGFTPVSWAGFTNFRNVMRDTAFLSTMRNTISYVLWSLIIGFWLPIVVAIMVNEIVHLKGTFKVLMYIPCILPTLATSLLWYFMYQPGESGVLNQILALFGVAPKVWLQDKNAVIPLIVVSMTWRGFGSTVIFYLASLQSINQDLYEAARIDGAGILKRIKSITIPNMLPVALLMFVKQIISIFKIVTEPMTMTDGGPNGASLSLGLQSYYYMFNYNQPANALAIGTITFAILMLINIFYFRLEKKIDVY